MLYEKEIKKVPWKKLEHAYGEASDVPELLIALAEGTKEERDKAYYELYGNVFHQGSRWEVTPHVVPILFYILQEKKTEEKDQLMAYLLCLAVGYPEEYIPYGFDVEAYISDDPEDYESQSYLKCVDYLNIVYDCMYDAKQKVRMMAVYMFAFFAKYLKEKTIERIKEIAYSANDVFERVNAILSLGVIQHQRSEKTYLPELKELFYKERVNDSNSFSDTEIEQKERLEKMAAACSILIIDGCKDNTDAFLYLIEILEKLGEEDIEILPWMENGLEEYIGSVIATTEKENLETAIKAIANCMEGLNCMASLKMTYYLLKMIFLLDSIEEPFMIGKFSEVSQEAFRAIGKYGAWKIGANGIFANYAEIIRAYHLPSTKESFLKFLEEE